MDIDAQTIEVEEPKHEPDHEHSTLMIVDIEEYKDCSLLLAVKEQESFSSDLPYYKTNFQSKIHIGVIKGELEDSIHNDSDSNTEGITKLKSLNGGSHSPNSANIDSGHIEIECKRTKLSAKVKNERSNITTNNASFSELVDSQIIPSNDIKCSSQVCTHVCNMQFKVDPSGENLSEQPGESSRGKIIQSPQRYHIVDPHDPGSVLCNVLGDTKHLAKGKESLSQMCLVCKKSFKNQYALNRHMLTHEKEARPLSKKLGNLGDLTQAVPHDKQHICPVCNKTFHSATVLTNHLQAHSKDTKHICSFCGRNFKFNSTLEQHLWTHTGVKPYACTICGKNFANSGNIKQHKLSHTGEKPYCCITCGKCFNHPTHYKQHLLIHTGVKNHQCEVCEKWFASTSAIQRHLRTHTGEKPYKCSVCGRGFTQSCQMKSHEEIHDKGSQRKRRLAEKDHKCSICNKLFRRGTHLRLHSLTHTEKKPHSCTVCDKAYSYAHDLKRHMLSHSDNNPLACSICRQAFTRKSYLQKHMKIHSMKENQ